MNPRIPFFVAALFLSACSLVPVERYIHEPTAEISNYLFTHQTLPRKFIPAPGEVLLVPDFRTFTAGFGGQSSHLKIFTSGERSVFIESAVLEVPEKNIMETLALNISTQPKKLEKSDVVWAAYVRLFVDDRVPDKNFDFSRVNGAKSMTLVIRWRDGTKIIENRFHLQFVVRREAAWVT